MNVTSTIQVDRPAPQVFAFLADATNNPKWQGGMRSCVWTSDGAIAVGSTYDQEAVFLGRPVVSSFVVTAIDPKRSISIETTESTFPIQVTRSVEALSETSCRVTAEVSGGPEGLLRLLNVFTTPMVRRSIRGDYARLREQLAP